MIGHEGPHTANYGLIGASRTSWFNHKRAIFTALASAAVVAVFFLAPFNADSSELTSLTSKPTKWHGVSLGGWLVMEINPSTRAPTDPMDLRPNWMYDFETQARSELDFVYELRAQGGDDFAIKTMRNHWDGYITEHMLDDAQDLGVDTVRLPVGYWIIDAPVGGTSPYEYGIGPDGFVTGGLNHLESMLISLKKRKMTALIDVHALPCNSACVSDGLSCAAPLAFAPPGAPNTTIGPMPRCGNKGVYPTTRVPTDELSTWGDVGIANVAALADWLSNLPPKAQSVSAYQLANEPALGPPGVYEEAVNRWYEKALPKARSKLSSTPLVLSFIPPTEAASSFLKQLNDNDTPGLLADHHFYLNWQGYDSDPPILPGDPPMSWKEIHWRACNAVNLGAIFLYTDLNLNLIIGEWSLAVNYDAPIDLDDKGIQKELGKLYREQLYVFDTTPEVRGHFFWTLRMGSGWDPRPTREHPKGKQLAGTSASKSKGGYPFKVWSLLEMARLGIATSLKKGYSDACDGQPGAARSIKG